MAAVLRLLDDPRGEVLDVGMGAGRLCAELGRRGWIVSGIDGSESMVALARERLPALADRLAQGDVQRLPFPDGTFEAATATGVLEYANIEETLAELARVLKPGGLAVVSYPNPRAVYGLWKTRVFYRAVRAVKALAGRRPMTTVGGSPPTPPRRFANLLREAGFSIEAVEYVSFLPTLTPLELLWPRLTERLGARLEGSGPRLGWVLATQVVYAARKPPGDVALEAAVRGA